MYKYHNQVSSTHLDETNILSSLAEALSAHVEVVFADNAALVTANTALASSLRSQDALWVRIQQTLSSHSRYILIAYGNLK